MKTTMPMEPERAMVAAPKLRGTTKRKEDNPGALASSVIQALLWPPALGKLSHP
jgi:hypothetical protein